VAIELAVEVFDLRERAAAARALHEPYDELIRHDSLSVGIYCLAAGQEDGQSPHTEDEVYYIVSGRGRIRVGDDDTSVRPGSVVFVAANEVHRFFDITEDLEILVFFAPAEGSTA
jgi:mannose-6-phosphate isomerase-like protein (cupin superfamily)